MTDGVHQPLRRLPHDCEVNSGPTAWGREDRERCEGRVFTADLKLPSEQAWVWEKGQRNSQVLENNESSAIALVTLHSN